MLDIPKYSFLISVALLTIIHADIKAGFSYFNDGSNFKSVSNLKYEEVTSKTELTMEAIKYVANNKDETNLHFNSEYNNNANISNFLYVDMLSNSGDKNYAWRGGSGLAIVPGGLDKVLSFPFRHVFSVAINYSSVFPNLIYPSWRYKFTGYLLGFGLKTAYQWHLSDYELTQELSYNLKPELAIKYSYSFNRTNGIDSKLNYLIMEINL